jgi:translation elongation factor EF-1beta
MSVGIVSGNVNVVIPVVPESPATGLSAFKNHVNHPEIKDMHQDKKKKDNRKRNAKGW